VLTAHSKSGIKIILKQYLISIKMLKLKYEHRVLSVDIFLFIYLFISRRLNNICYTMPSKTFQNTDPTT
jgi:hypothetical protein